MLQKPLHLIGAAFGIAAKTPGCADGPKLIKASNKLTSLSGVNASWATIIEEQSAPSGLAAMPAVAKACNELAEQSENFTRLGEKFLTIGGDHSCAIGTWSGTAHALRDKGDLGLIWIDAHMDAHTPETSESGNIHGMPVAALLGYGDESLTQLCDTLPKIKPENICLIGIRSYEKLERDLLEKLGARIYYIEEVGKRSINAVMNEAIDHVTKHTCNFGITIDLDGLDPKDAPAVGTPVDSGIRAKDFLQTLQAINKHKNFIGAEIVEFNPSLVKTGRTEQLVYDLATELFAQT